MNFKYLEKAIIYYENHGKNASETCRVFDVDRRLILDWIKNKDKISSAKDKRNSWQVHHKKIEGWYPTMESELFVWIVAQRASNKAVSGLDIKHQAKIEYEKSPQVEKDKGNLLNNNFFFNIFVQHY